MSEPLTITMSEAQRHRLAMLEQRVREATALRDTYVQALVDTTGLPDTVTVTGWTLDGNTLTLHTQQDEQTEGVDR